MFRDRGLPTTVGRRMSHRAHCIDGGPECLCFPHLGSEGCAAGLLRGGDLRQSSTFKGFGLVSSASISAEAIAAGAAVRRQQRQFLLVAQCLHSPVRGKFADPDLCHNCDGKTSRSARLRAGFSGAIPGCGRSRLIRRLGQ